MRENKAHVNIALISKVSSLGLRKEVKICSRRFGFENEDVVGFLISQKKTENRKKGRKLIQFASSSLPPLANLIAAKSTNKKSGKM